MGRRAAPCLLKCQRLWSCTAPWGAGHLSSPPRTGGSWPGQRLPGISVHRRLALLPTNLPRASAPPTVSLGGLKATESLSSGLQGKPQTGRVTALPTAWPGPWSLEWLWVGGVAGGGHPHLCCDFQMLGALPRHPLLTLTPFQPPATPGSHSPLTLKAEVGVGPAGTDRPAHAPRQKGFPRQRGDRPLNSQR